MGLSKSEAGRLGYEKNKFLFDKQREDKARLAREKYEQNKKFCLHCSSEVSYEKRLNSFCSKKCSATFNNLKRGRASRDNAIKCLHCKKDVSHKGKYCSFKCQHDFKRIESVINGTAGHAAVKRYLLNLNGSKCMECGWDKVNPVTNKVPIELEHIDGNSKNNELSNLKLLCPNCHSLTPTYKALNKGKGRHERMKRYKEGKSF